MKKTLHFTLCAGILLFITQFINADIVTKGDTIFVDETWSDTIHVTGDIVVVDDVTLDIAPGTYVDFQGHYMLKILGTILAIGEDSDSIIFSRSDSAGFTDFDITDGSWKGIYLNNATNYFGADGAMNDNDTSVFSKCRIEFIKILSGGDGAPISPIQVTQYSKLLIKGCEIQSNYTFHRGGAIWMNTESDILVKNNFIHHNTVWMHGGGIHITNSSPIIIGNTISYNKTLSTVSFEGRGGGIYAVGGNGVVINNTIQHNSALSGSGINYVNYSGTMKGNTIAYNEGYGDVGVESRGGGISLGSSSAPLIINNKIANNVADNGGGLYTENSLPAIINNLIVNNTGTLNGGAWQAISTEGAFVNNTVANNAGATGDGVQVQDSDPIFMNNILWGGNDLLHLQDVFAKIHIQNCIIEDTISSIWGSGSYTSENLSEDDPDFENASADFGNDYDGLGIGVDWSVTDSSSCVNGGVQNLGELPVPVKDLAGNPRIEHAIIDIGAYEVLVEYIPFEDTIKSDTTWIADTVKITGDVVVDDEVTLTILPGTYVEFQGPYRLQVNGTLNAAGTISSPILFSVKDTLGFANIYSDSGSWEGIYFDNSYDGMNNAMTDNDSSVLRFCDFSFAKHMGMGDIVSGAALTVRYYGGIEISSCHFHNNASRFGAGGIYIHKSNLTISNCKFDYNYSDQGSAINANTSEMIISNSLFTENYSRDNGGAIFLSGTDAIVENNTLTYNRSNNGGAIWLGHSPGKIMNNFFSNNEAYIDGGALFIRYTGTNLINNIVVNNSAGNKGGAMAWRYADDMLTINNTICNNWTDFRGGGVHNYFTTHQAFNDIYYGNNLNDAVDGILGQNYHMSSSLSDVSFMNCNLGGGIDSIFIFNGEAFTGTIENSIDSLPDFILPSEGPGSGYDGIEARWWVKSVSPCINSGTLAIEQYLGSTDSRGNPRIFGDSIDIGAYESQYGPPEITLHPINQIVCTGDTVRLNVNTRFQSTFQWQWNGYDIPGATEKEYRIDSVTSAYDGNYQCIISNSHGSVSSSSAYLLARAQPGLLQQPENVWAVEGEKTIIHSAGTGTPPLRFQWYKNGVQMPNATWPDLWINNTGPQHEGLFHVELTNACNTIQSDTVQLYLAPQICMVTVDTNTSNNLVVWEKNSSAPIESYNVYRESIVAGEYEAIGNVPVDSLSVYVDTAVNPVSQAYIYKITALDIDGNESDINLCQPHKTIHLLSSENSELLTIQLDWTYYYGFDYGTFHIYRGLSGAGIDSVHSISSSSTQWIDTESDPGVDYYYRVIVLKDTPCTPSSSKKAGAGPYNHSLSNLDNSRLQNTGINDLKEASLVVYPNPLTEAATIEFPNQEHSKYKMILRDLSGKAVLIKDDITEDRVTIQRGNLSPGFYSVELVGDKTMRGRLIVR
jgi:hypothetical protein